MSENGAISQASLAAALLARFEERPGPEAAGPEATGPEAAGFEAVSGEDGAEGAERAAAQAKVFLERVPAGYLERATLPEVVEDLLAVAAFGVSSDSTEAQPRMTVRSATEAGTFRLIRYATHPIELSAFLPTLESCGLTVVEAVPHQLAPGPNGEPPVHVDDFGVRVAPTIVPDPPFDPRADGSRLVAAIRAVEENRIALDPLNRLVVAAGLSWDQILVLQAYGRYCLQAGVVWDDHQLSDPLVAFPSVTRSLVDLFTARFDPDASALPDERRERKRVSDALGAVTRLEQDQVLRTYLTLIEATLRTNAFVRDRAGSRPRALSLKLDSQRIGFLPHPLPRFETFVYGPDVKGIHLRDGLVARGGIRWSDRHDDLRSEILDLVAAQAKKNAIIVPTGAKGGFVCHVLRSPRPRPARETAAVVRRGYEAFIRGLLDITDNIENGEVVSPPGVITFDGPDPYLVVAADRGTATFSDLANSISAEYGFWLGDAFASGGSRGYDHKAMGITARGAWIAVRRHFQQLGVDVSREPIRVVGVGDMSGDVFGNGLLSSRSLQLVAAFDHRDIFVDPYPDPERSFAERQRLAGMSVSSWQDYDRRIISPGGGVWSRQTKRIELPSEAVTALNLQAATLTPPELVSAILAAPVDLLWFGGIGTFIKAPDEPDDAVGDHDNDAVRITSDRVRARVIAEGANLGITQRARIRYSRRGGRINADFIDNAAGVATSDREVNLKILLGRAIETGRLASDRRDQLLADVEDEVAAAVLAQVDHSVTALNRAVAHSAEELDAYAAMIDDLEASGELERAVEALPSDEELARRREAGAGLIRPELAVLLAYAKSSLVHAIEASSLAEDPSVLDAVLPYFPPVIQRSFGDLVPTHRLYPQLVATDVAGVAVDQMGIIWAAETASELGRSPAEVAAAFWAACQVLDANRYWQDLEAASDQLPVDVEGQLHGQVTAALDALVRRFLNRGGPIQPAELLTTYRPITLELLDEVGPGSIADERAQALRGQGVDSGLAASFARLADLAWVPDVGSLIRRHRVRPGEALAILDAVNRDLGVERLRSTLLALRGRSRWSAWQARALRDDLTELGARAASAVLASAAPQDLPPTERVATWAGGHAGALARARQLTGQVHADSPDGLAVAGLAVRAFQQVMERPGT